MLRPEVDSRKRSQIYEEENIQFSFVFFQSVSLFLSPFTAPFFHLVDLVILCQKSYIKRRVNVAVYVHHKTKLYKSL